MTEMRECREGGTCAESIVDLHTHTTFSDGTMRPKEVVDLAGKRGLKVIAITDHDTVEGLPQATGYGRTIGVEIVPGIELSCREEQQGFEDIHVLGLFIDPQNRELEQKTIAMQNARKKRILGMIAKLRNEGFSIPFEEVAAKAQWALGRPHLAMVLLEKYPDMFASVQDVFDRYLGTGKAAYVPRSDKITIQEAVALIHQAGGIASLAHPCVYNGVDLRELLWFFVAAGGDAVETYYPYSTNIKNVTEEEANRRNEFIKKLVKEKGMLETGGSDFHGSIREIMLGGGGVPPKVFERLRRNVRGK